MMIISKNRKVLIGVKDKDIRKGVFIIPSSVTHIGDSAFANCRSLVEVIVPDSVTSIGDNAFAECGSIKKLTISNFVTHIGDFAFMRCINLTKVFIPDSVTYIGDGAFERCSGLKKLTIPNFVTHIGDGAFADCGGLMELSIPDALIHIGNSVFADCRGLMELSIPDAVTHIGVMAFFNCSGLTKVFIPNSVTHIGIGAFSRCNFVELFLSNAIMRIDEGAFSGCINLRVIVVDVSNDEAFQRIYALVPQEQRKLLISLSLYQEIAKARNMELTLTRNEHIYIPLWRLPQELINLIFQFEGRVHDVINKVPLPKKSNELSIYREALLTEHTRFIQKQYFLIQRAIVIHKLQKVIEYIQQEISNKQKVIGFFSNRTNASLKIEREFRINVIGKLIQRLAGDTTVIFSRKETLLLSVPLIRKIIKPFNLNAYIQPVSASILVSMVDYVAEEVGCGRACHIS